MSLLDRMARDIEQGCDHSDKRRENGPCCDDYRSNPDHR